VLRFEGVDSQFRVWLNGRELGSGSFDAATGRLVRIGDLPVDGPLLDLWRAPTDNDRGHHGEAVEPLWRRVGLDRLQHRVDEVTVGEDALVVRARVGPAGTDLGVVATYRWSAVPGGLRLELGVVPEGDWPCPLPRVGLRMAVPAGLRRVEWFGRGPGEAYADTGRLDQRAARRRPPPTCTPATASGSTSTRPPGSLTVRLYPAPAEPSRR
jgi:beta-galactosidase